MIKKGVIISFTLLVLLTGSLLARQEIEIAVSDILFSENTVYNSPATNLIDNNESTGWRLEKGAQEGWSELFLEEKTLIYGLEIAGELNEDTKLVIEYLNNDQWLPFINSVITELSQKVVDLSYDSIVTDKLRLRLKGNDINESELNKIKVIGQAADSKEHNIKTGS